MFAKLNMVLDRKFENQHVQSYFTYFVNNNVKILALFG